MIAITAIAKKVTRSKDKKNKNKLSKSIDIFPSHIAFKFYENWVNSTVFCPLKKFSNSILLKRYRLGRARYD